MVNWSIYLLIYLFIYLFICLFIYLFIYIFINLFKVDNDNKATVYKNTYKIASG